MQVPKCLSGAPIKDHVASCLSKDASTVRH
jgi:hypothetical protein